AADSDGPISTARPRPFRPHPLALLHLARLGGFVRPCRVPHRVAALLGCPDRRSHAPPAVHRRLRMVLLPGCRGMEGAVCLTVHRAGYTLSKPVSDSKPKVVVVMPAYNAAKTLHMTYADLPREMVDLVILVDDGSSDETIR